MELAGKHSGKVVVVTGAAFGMGRAMCERFVADGASVVAFDRADDVREVAAGLGDAVIAFQGDVSSSAHVSAVVELAVTHFGGLDIMCNNAGITYPPRPMIEVSEEDYDRMQDINAKGVFLGIKYAVPAMRDTRGGGSIVNTASTSSLRALNGRAAYGASKAAVASLTQTAALEYAKDNIRVNAICPGPTRTQIMEQAIENIPGVLGMLAKNVPLGRVADPSEIASVASFLARSDASFMTGAIVVVDGGVTAQHF